MNTPEFDVVIAGAGMAGASLGWQLARDSRVLVLERESQPGYHSTGRSAAMFMESYGPPQVRALTRASRAFYTQPPDGFAEHALLMRRGVFYVAWQGQEALFDARLAELQSTGTAVERIGAAEALRRVPVLQRDGLLGAIVEPDAMDIDVHALHQGFLHGVRAQGGEQWNDAEVVAAERDTEMWTLTLADGRQMRTRTLVNATGAWADTLAQLAGARPLGLQAKRRSAFTFTPPQGTDIHRWPAVVAIDESWYFKPEAGLLLGSPANADPVLAHDVAAEEMDVALGIANIERDTTLSIRRPRHTWAGLRTFAPDGELVIGWDGERDGLFWLAGQGGYGIQTAAAAAELAAALLRNASVPESLKREGVDAQAMAPSRLR